MRFWEFVRDTPFFQFVRECRMERYEKYICPAHGDVVQAVRLKNLGKKDGLYCAKCQGEFWAKTLKRVTPVK